VKLPSDLGGAPRGWFLPITEARAMGLAIAVEGQVEQVMIVIVAEEEIQRMISS
jgi:hypothetical protein